MGSIFLTSFDDSVRYEKLNERFQGSQTGINLFNTDPALITAFDMPPDARVVAFDLPAALVNRMSEGNVSNPQPLPSLNTEIGWQFIGFDVVDPYTQTSALHGFDLPVSRIEQVLDLNSARLNSHGLLNDYITADRVAATFGEMFVEHAPFTPSGVWLKDSAQK